MGEPGGLLSMGLHRVERDLAAAAEEPCHRLQEKSCKSSIQQIFIMKLFVIECLLYLDVKGIGTHFEIRS